jgi:hypothetical protein
MKKTDLFNAMTILSGNLDVLIYGARQTGKTHSLRELAEMLVNSGIRVLYLAENMTSIRLNKIQGIKCVSTGIIGNEMYLRGFSNGVILIDSDKDYVDMKVMEQIAPVRSMGTRVVYCLNRTSPVGLPIAGCDTFRLVIDLNKEVREKIMEKTVDIDCIKTAKAKIA